MPRADLCASFDESACHRAASRCAWTSAAVFLVLWLGLLAAGRSKLFQDPGTFWHTKVGLRLIDSGRFESTDAFTFTFAGQRWIPHQWLGETAMAMAYRWGGWDLQLLVAATILAALYAWMAHRMLAAGWHWFAVILLLTSVIAASSHHFHVRPHLASLVGMGILFALLCDAESVTEGISSRRLGWLVPLFAVWANLHGGALGGLATLALVLTGWLVFGVLHPAGSTNPQRQQGICSSAGFTRLRLGLVFAACGLAVFINPYGPALPQSWLTIMSLSLPDFIQEHKHLDWHEPAACMLLVIGAAYIVALLGVPWRNWHVTWLVPLVWFLLTLDRIRHAPLFGLLAAIALAEIVPQTRWKAWLREHDYLRMPVPWIARQAAAPIAVCTALVCAAIAMQSGSLLVPIVGAGWARLDPAVWPVELLPALRDLERTADDRRIFNALDFGGFLTFHCPRLPTFIDDRCELFGDEFLREYAQAERERPETIDLWQRRYGFQHALVRRGSPFDIYLSQQQLWNMVQCDAAAALYRLQDAGAL